MINFQDLAKILGEEFDREDWGDIDPDLFNLVSEGARDVDSYEDIVAMEKVLKRVANRLEEI